MTDDEKREQYVQDCTYDYCSDVDYDCYKCYQSAVEQGVVGDE